jgi:dihydrofolate reductase/thymidylate synthase
MFQLILATDLRYGIGNNGTLPWPKNQKDMDFFRKKTTGGIVIMGRKTWDSIPAKHRPLKNRLNIVLTTDNSFVSTDTTFFKNSVDDIVACIKGLKKETEGYENAEVFIIGGATLYKQFLTMNLVNKIWLTKINNTYECDTFFDVSTLYNFRVASSVRDCELQFMEYDYYNAEEHNYLSHLKNIIRNGTYRENRTGVNTYSIFCPPQLKFDLTGNKFPLLTTKKCVLRQIFVELQFYLSGKSDSKLLEEQKVFVWKGNTTREFLDGRGLQHYREGDMGPSYSFNFRHIGADYKGCDEDYTGKGVDQLQYCIDLIKNNPSSRRIIIDLWDPTKLDEMSLPPCMFLYQFYVENGVLHCNANLRSSDTFLGLPWNIATASLLTIMMAHVCDIKPGTLTVTTNDAHVYENQLDAINTQLERKPHVFPLLYLNTEEKDITKLNYKDFTLVNYSPYPGFRVPMVV